MSTINGESGADAETSSDKTESRGSEPEFLVALVRVASGCGIREVRVVSVPAVSTCRVVEAALRTLQARGIVLSRVLEFRDLGDSTTIATYLDTGDRLILNTAAEFWKDPFGRMAYLFRNRTLVSDDPRAIVYHEVGHVLHRRRYRWG
jgi:hypothetical protein